MSPPKHHHRSSVASATSPLHSPDSDDIHEDWRREAISGGSLSRVDLHSGTNGWASPPGDLFSLRGPSYFNKKSKSPSGAWLLQPAGVDWLRSNSKLDHYLSHPNNRVLHALNKSKSQSLKPFVIAVNLQIPGKDHHSAVFYFYTTETHQIEPGSSTAIWNWNWM